MPSSASSAPGAQPPRIGVVGAGGIGLLFAAMLGSAIDTRQADTRVIVASRRSDIRRLLEQEGIVVEAERRTVRLPPDRLAAWDPAKPPPGRCDLVVVASRSQESDYAVETAARLAAPNGCALVIQNGLRAWQQARRTGLRSVFGATYEIAHIAPPRTRVVWTRTGRTEISSRDDSDVALVNGLLANASLQVEAHANEAEVLWRKLFVTISNWIAAAVGAPLHAAAASTAAEELFLAVVAELEPVAAADGAQIERSWSSGEFAALRASPTSIGSAYVALRNGQEPEVIDICRSVVERAEALGLATPRTATLMQLTAIQSDVFLTERNGASAR